MTQYSLFGDDNFEEAPKKVAKTEVSNPAPKPSLEPELINENVEELNVKVIEIVEIEVKTEIENDNVEDIYKQEIAEPVIEEIEIFNSKSETNIIPLGDINADFVLDEKSLEDNYVREVFIFEEPEQELAEEEKEEKIVSKKEKPNAEVVIKSKTTRGRLKLSQTHLAASSIEVPEDEILFSKKYYSIGIVAKMFDVNISLLRYWENEFTILKPRKNAKGDRHFRPEDIKNIQLIHHLLREKKYTLEGAKDFLKKTKNTEDPLAIIENLKDLKSFLLEIKTNL